MSVPLSDFLELKAHVEAMTESAAISQQEVNTFYLLVCGSMIFMMQAGFALLAAGSIRMKNVKNILLKSVMDACIGGLVWYLWGYGLAYNADKETAPTYNAFIGTGRSNFALSGIHDWEEANTAKGYDWIFFFFQYTFAASAATIVSGAVAERCTLTGYLVYCVFVVGVIYPIVVHWVWDSSGFLSAFNPNAMLSGMIDFAGSGVVHMTGGVAAFVAAAILGPRRGRWESPERFNGQSASLQVLGTFLLWFGWYGFNPGSTLLLHGYARDMARAAVTTTLAACSGATTGLFLKFLLPAKLGGSGFWDLGHTCNSLLGGLVSITAGCTVVDPYAAIIMGGIGALVYHCMSCALRKMKIDDPLDAAAVHGACGFWGCFAVSFFATCGYSYAPAVGSPWRLDANGEDLGVDCGVFYGGRGTLFVANLAGPIIIAAWVGVTSVVLFSTLKLLGIFRVSEEVELAGCDVSKHGGSAYPEQATMAESQVAKA